ncbi:Transcriptional regulatory protein LiaR [Austwickia sp. TVS 96-490-7B]|uniref:response regulator n=1 Tax=Austwickia sp. TVS 96-490-7B TaxID=2830843 RepID=UPI001C5988B8|nr:response regulator transcription factor [Austwickia sp. TVS 96-490-7B]MBW3086858.1 Transcriptional regulatory protein LiaR [Austwickia sp. TVS 96-490-7B]
MTTTVLIVDDHPVVRAGLRMLLDADPTITVVGEAADGQTAVDAARALTPDVVLCDLRLGDGLDGVGVVRSLVTDSPGAPACPPAVVILTTYDHDRDIVRAVEAGASGYLLKDADPRDIITAVRRAAAGETVLSAAQEARVVTTMRAGHRTLSARELDVLRLLADGLANRQIAGRLSVSEATVKTHLAHIYDKLGATSRTAAVHAAQAHGVL